MYVLFIPSFPNNCFHLGNIRTKQKRWKKRKKEEAEVESLRYKHCIVYSLTTWRTFCYFLFCFIFFSNCERVFKFLLHFLLSLLFPFFFFLFFFWIKQVSLFETCNGSDLSYSLTFCFWLQRNTWRAWQVRFISVTWSIRLRFFFELVFRLDSFFELQRAQRWFGFCLRASERCVLLRTFVPV